MVDTVEGTDTSFWQDADFTPARPDYTRAYLQGSRFNIHRIGQGLNVDPDFKVNWANARSAGMLNGGYWVWDYRYTMSSQIDLMDTTLAADRGDIQVALDLERIPTGTPGVYHALPPRPNIYAACDLFIQGVYAKEGRYPLMYTNLEWLLYIIPDPTPLMLKCPLWLAAPGAVPPYRTGAWLFATFVQHSWHGDGRLYGMESGNIDLDRFLLGGYDKLLEFCKRKPAELTWAQRVTAALRELGKEVGEPE